MRSHMINLSVFFSSTFCFYNSFFRYLSFPVVAVQMELSRRRVPLYVSICRHLWFEISVSN